MKLTKIINNYMKEKISKTELEAAIKNSNIQKEALGL
jgi:hypothetical protein